MKLLGDNNPKSVLSNEDIYNIYYSTQSTYELAKIYCVSKQVITNVKRKISYRNVSLNFNGNPGWHGGKGANRPIPIDYIPCIFSESGSYTYFLEKYGASEVTVNSIKSKKLYRKYTSELEVPGQIIRYKLTYDMINDIYTSFEDPMLLSQKYGVTIQTIKNIKNNRTRINSIWNDF